ncbi:MAG: hypothetical protein WBN28_07075, partial [Lutimonas sp.]
MDLDTRKKELVKEFSPMLQKKGGPSRIWMFTLIVLIAIGLVAFFIQLKNGHVVTGMRDNVV